MVIHVSAQNWDKTDIHLLAWQVMNFWDGMVRWAVPVFVMISGALFLNRDIPIRKLYGKYIFRIFTAFVFWSFLYTVTLKQDELEPIEYLEHFLMGHYHMWFLYAIAGLYVIVPFVRKIAESELLTKYFLGLAFVLASLLPNTVDIIPLFSEKYGELACKVAGNFYVSFVAGFTGYFLLGHFLNTEIISRKAERLIYAAGIIGAIMCIVLSSLVSLATGVPTEMFYRELMVTTMFQAIALFVFFRERLNFPARFIRTLSQYSFGAYLVHPEVIEILREFGLNTLTFSPIISIPVIVAIVFVISFAISAILNQIPVLKKFIV